jgi:EpsI family protein
MNTTSTMNTSATAGQTPPLPTRRLVVLGGAMVAAAAAGELLRPDRRLAEVKARIALEKQVPEAFGDWRIDRSIRPVLPDPSLQAMLDVLYSQLLARTYVNPRGQRVMLTIAYGSDQGNEATAVHRPEFCYSAQGFRVRAVGTTTLAIGQARVPVAKLVAQLGQRNEPITYWVTLDETATLPGVGRKLAQIRYGLAGDIPDGMLVRVSSVGSNEPEAFAMQKGFLDQMYEAVPADVRARYFGAAARA